MTDRVCENCGMPDEELLLVHRVYVIPERWDQPGEEKVLPDAELWCVSCCSQYPHNPAQTDTEGD
jgi:hypothetical protein